MTLLITGGCGWIGSFLALEFLDKKIVDKIKIVDVIEPPKGIEDKINSSSIEFIKNDLSNQNELKKILQDVEQVIHLAAIADVKKCETDTEFSRKINVEGTKNLLDSIVSSNVTKFIFASTMSAIYGNATKFDEQDPVNPITEYGKQKKESELLIKKNAEEHNIRSIVLRKSNLYGIGLTVKQNVVAAFVKNGIEKGSISISGSGNQYRNFLNIKDAITAYSHATTKKINNNFEVINISGPEVFTVNELAQKVKSQIAKQTQKQIEIIRESNLPNEGEITEPEISTQKAKTILDYVPKVNVDQGISELVQYYKK